MKQGRPILRNSIYRALGESIRRHREAAGLRQEDLGAKIGLSRTSIVNIEAGRQGVSLHVVLAIARALRVDSFFLIPRRGR